MTAKQPAVKKYVVRLGDDERERLNTLIRRGKARAGQLLKARILLKADASPGATAGSLRRWIPGSTPLPVRASYWWRKASIPH